MTTLLLWMGLYSSNLLKVVYVCTLTKGYMSKKCPRRKNWTEFWFVLRPNFLGYYVSEDLMEIKGMIALDSNCTVEVQPHCCSVDHTHY